MPYGKPANCAPAGVQWQFATPTLRSWTRIAYSPSLDRIAMVAGTGHIAISNDGGLTWTETAALGVTHNDIAWSPAQNLFVVVGVNYNTCYTSPDGIVWTNRAMASGFNNRSVAWAGDPINLFVVGANNAGGSLNDIQTSPDGIAWTARPTPDMNGTINFVAYNNDAGSPRLLAGNNVGRIMNSATALAWGEASPAIGAQALQGAVWVPLLGLWVVSAGSGLNFATSPTGTGAWTSRPIPTQSAWTRPAWTGLRLINVGFAGTLRLMESLNATAYTAKALTDQNWTDVIWIPERQILVACASTGNNRIAISQG